VPCGSGPIVAVAGTAPIGDDGNTVGIGDVYQQTRRCLQISKQALEAADATLEAVYRTRVMLTDISRWKEAARAHGEVFSSIKPACTFVEVSRLINDEWLVETEVDAFLGEQG
jgi:enamine deaminase RidA (YjgF/YER057c/UK114 family)